LHAASDGDFILIKQTVLTGATPHDAPAPEQLRELSPAELELVGGGLPGRTWGVTEPTAQATSLSVEPLPGRTW
jgi:hypothetical protein